MQNYNAEFKIKNLFRTLSCNFELCILHFEFEQSELTMQSEQTPCWPLPYGAYPSFS